MVPTLDNPTWDHHLACTKGMVLLLAKECHHMDHMVTLMAPGLDRDLMEDHLMVLVLTVQDQVDSILVILPKVDRLLGSIPVPLDGMGPVHPLAKAVHLLLVSQELLHLVILA